MLVVDDDPTVRRACRDFLAERTDVELVAEVADGDLAEEAYERARPDVVLMDLQMVRMSGIEATRVLCRRWPRACVVAMTTFASRDHVVAALRAGASGYLVKGLSGPQLVAALHQAVAGDMPLSSVVRRELVSTVVAESTPAQPARSSTNRQLTDREVELVNWIAHGLTNRQVAARMNLSEGSVKQYVARVADKLDASSRTQVLVRTIQLGLVDVSQLPVPGDHDA